MLKRALLASLRLIALLLTAGCAAAWAQAEPCAGPGSADVTVKTLIEQSRKEIKAFRDSGGKPDDPSHPALRWSETLWQCREAFPNTTAATDATAEAVHILIHAAHARRALELADSVPADDPAWDKLLNFVHEAAAEANDCRGCVRRIEHLLPKWQDPKLRARAQLVVADAHMKMGETDQAIAWFETVQREAPGTPQADHAAMGLQQLRWLNPGQAAPAFQGKSRQGQVVSLAGFRDRAVVLIFWSTT
ncbi:MAG: hypothetical protein ACRD5G_07710 [Candidatus Acidiferrales bacterium]